LGVEALRGFPLPVAATTFAALCPSDASIVFGDHDPKAVTRKTMKDKGLMHLEGPFATERFYPLSVGRASLSLVFPSEEIPLESWLYLSAEPPLMDFQQLQINPKLLPLYRVSKNSRMGSSPERVTTLYGVFCPGNWSTEVD